MNKIIVSLDNLSKDYALQIANDISDQVWGFAINDLFFKYGANIIYELSSLNKVMVDLKLYNSLKVMRNNIQTLIACGSSLITIHCDAKYSASDEEIPYLIGYPTSGINLITWPDHICNINYFPVHYGHLLCRKNDLPFLNDKDLPFKKICFNVKLSECQDAISNGADLLLLGKEITHTESYLNTITELNACLS